jgi:hypothetical protein
MCLRDAHESLQVWECAEGAPPFADVEDTSALGDRWPPLSRAAALSDAFHEFLCLCSEPPVSRPAASQLLQVRRSAILSPALTR